MNEKKTPEEEKEELTDLSGDGAGQQSKVGVPYSGKGDVQRGVRDRMHADAKEKSREKK